MITSIQYCFPRFHNAMVDPLVSLLRERGSYDEGDGGDYQQHEAAEQPWIE